MSLSICHEICPLPCTPTLPQGAQAALTGVDQGKGLWEHKLGPPCNLDMLVLAESDLFYPVQNICLCIPEKKKEGGGEIGEEGRRE